MGASNAASYTIGQALPGHLHFILASWVKTAQSAFRAAGQPAWICRAAHALAWETLQAPGARVLVAHDPDDADHVFGYCVSNDAILQQVYVKSAFRGRGLGRALVAAAGCARPGLRVRVSWSTRHLLATGWPVEVIIGKDKQYQAGNA